ncbi:protein phosphatase 1J [Protopterus annectens]|uniref:protein phosphatase 1J n=1 Tax=Protopterus annectens TaxID=7888 RepID=UPI001CFA537A|nr:protein phosphatase 1J [Protopterus annectens]
MLATAKGGGLFKSGAENMMKKIKTTMNNVAASLSNSHHQRSHHASSGSNPCASTIAPPSPSLPGKYPYSRPEFLELTPPELQRSMDHNNREILSNRGRRRLPLNTGYAEVINSGKSTYNEDQANYEVVVITKKNNKTPSHNEPLIDDVNNSDKQASLSMSNMSFNYWGLFDGHAGTDAAIMASKLLHFHICEQLREIADILANPSFIPPICLDNDIKSAPAEQNREEPLEKDLQTPNDTMNRFHLEKEVSQENIVIGAIETAFRKMDEQIAKEKSSYTIVGGCCALAVIHFHRKLYVANAGDSRAIILRNREIIPMSNEFTPETERQRLQYLGKLKPELLGNEFTALEFPRRIQHKEVGKKMLYRDHSMMGWAYKTIEEDDLKFPLVYGEGKKARVMATIGVTRGFGDHDLKVYSSNIYIKPFLSCCPEVKVYDLMQYEHCPDDVMVVGTDGLWDVISNKEVANAVLNVFAAYKPDDPSRYIVAAEDLILRARGVLKEQSWRLASNKLGSGDDISVFVIPLYSLSNCT